MSNVAGAHTRTQIEACLAAALGIGPERFEWMVSKPELAGLKNGYRRPEQLGSDRFASAIGARALFPNRVLLVVTCGTATTIDLVSADGEFVGGMILPGPRTMAASLAASTAQLPDVAGPAEFVATFADNTMEAIVSGCIAAQVGAIEHAFAQCLRRHAESDLQCVLAGGAATAIAASLAIPVAHVDNLVLIGLHAIAKGRANSSLC
jgi:type III pantothenate kinase